MRVLVTGSSGFVGRHLVSALVSRGAAVIEADRRRGDHLDDLDDCRRLFHWGPHVVVHLASSCSTPGSMSDPLGTVRDTVSTTVNVLECARENGGLPVIVTSSVKARDARTPYGAAKRMVEDWSSEFARSFDLPVVINRPGTIYGPGQQGSPESGWVAWFLEARDSGAEVTINGDGSQVRDLLHVSDYVDLLLTQLDDVHRYAGYGHVFDVGGGHGNVVTVEQLARHLGVRYRHGPPRYGDAPYYVGLNNVPGWEPRVWWRDSETLR